MKGAEAVLRKSTLLGKPVVIKDRISKKYRIKKLDEKLRRERTRAEARLLHRAKLAGADCPVVLEVKEFSLTIGFIEGKRPEMTQSQALKAGKMLADLHDSDIIHGDYTPANLILGGETLYVIDFGLGFVSSDIEDKAVDVFTMLRAISEKDSFLEGYSSCKKAKSILKRVKAVEKRVRYAF
ncbi:Kae1-associated serine/threonine protein kinase [Candidatus Micrarchaeota archaeon]|nr:Kae1-associated serine/threonine protein kinase [Candidatus Micrarchaeota archaeon]